MSESILIALMGGLGVLLIFSSFLVPKSTGSKIINEGDKVRIGSIAEGVVIMQMFSDISKRIRPVKGDLSERLRKSGHVYANEIVYHSRRMTAALLAAVAGIAAAIVFHMGFFSAAIITTGLVVLGFMSVDFTINKATKDRQKRIVNEMGFGLAQISLAIHSGATLEEAIGSASEVGLFGKICDYISKSISTAKPISDIIGHVNHEMPDIPELTAFLELLRVGGAKGQNIVEPFDRMAKIMRNNLSLNTIEAAHRSKLMVTAITSGFIFFATLVVAVGPGLQMMQAGGIF